MEPMMSTFRKKRLTRACRITGPFEVVTREGTLTCPDGYLALDSKGWPYPIAVDEFDEIYEIVRESTTKEPLSK
jgi:hypothetical protein